MHKNKLGLWMLGWWVVIAMTACTDTEVVVSEAGSCSFRIDTRAESSHQKVRLYVADRRPELDVFVNPLCLYNPPEWQFDLAQPDAEGKTSYFLEGLLAQWYKLAFVCVPENVEYKTMGTGSASLDFTQQWLDYTPVLSQSNQTDATDRSIYRKVVDRWLKKNENLTEDVILERITGQLIVDMGILADQFEKEVKAVEVQLKDVPKGLYVHDQSFGEIILVDEVADYSYKGATDGQQHYIIRANLLPMKLQDCKVQVTFTDDTKAVYPLITNAETVEQQQVEIKANTRTTLYFHGMEDDEFEVRYAGFKEGDANIAIDDDAWDGWQDSYMVEYAVEGRGISMSRAGTEDSRVQSLTYLLYRQMDEGHYYLVSKRNVPDMANAKWPLSRENGMTWEQREALKDTLLVGVNYKAVFVTNAADEGRLTGVNVMEDDEELTGVSTYTDARLVLPDVVTPTNMFYLAVKDIDGTSASHDTPTHCGVVLQRTVTRTDIQCSTQPTVEELINRSEVWTYIEEQYKQEVSGLKTLLVSDAPMDFAKVKDLPYGDGTIETVLKSNMTTELGNNPLWNCFSTSTARVTYQNDTYANVMSFDRVSANTIPAVTKIANKDNGIFTCYSFGANAADNSQNVITSVTMGSVSIATDLKTNQGINEHYLMTCTPFENFKNPSSEVKRLEVTLNAWELFVPESSRTDNYKVNLNAALAATGQTIEAYTIQLEYPDMGQASVWTPGWSIEKQ